MAIVNKTHALVGMKVGLKYFCMFSPVFILLILAADICQIRPWREGHWIPGRSRSAVLHLSYTECPLPV